MEQDYLNEQVKSEMHQSVVEVGTNICNNVHEKPKN
jgi:carboxylate-amine ligase